MLQHWLVKLQNLPVSGRQWDCDIPKAVLGDQSVGSVQAVTELACDVHWQFSLKPAGDVYRLTGQWHGAINRHCSRCNAAFAWQARGESAWEFQLGVEPDDVESESTCEYVEPPGELNLVDILREDIWLAWKADVVCSDSCKGLCQGCGVNLNTETCQCKEDKSDHPFAALRKLKLDG